MIEVAIMVEGQNGLNWPRWQRIAQVVEESGFVGLYRSDHYTNADPPDKDSLELWVSLTWLASHTRRIAFGPLVSPISFRHPTMTARMAAAVDDLSGGRLALGLGAGWNVREHTNYGWDLLDVPARFARFEEGLKVITSLLQSDTPVSFDGKYYPLHDAIILPRPHRPGGPSITIGGNGKERTLPLAARYANEWNAVFLPPAKITALNAHLDDLLTANGRHPMDVRRSLMTNCVFGRTEGDVQRKIAASGSTAQSSAELRQQGAVAGTPDDLVEQLNQLEKAGIYRVMLQWLDLDDIAGLEAIAADVLPKLNRA